MSNEVLSDLDKEIEEMENLIANRSKEPGELVADVEDVIDPGMLTEVAPPDPSNDLIPEPTDDQKEVTKQREDWKKRYKTYKATTDGTIHSLRVNEANLSNRVSKLSEEIGELNKKLSEAASKVAEPSIEESFTPEQREVLGDEALALMRKMTRDSVAEATKSMREQRDKEAEERREQLNNQAQISAEVVANQFRDMLSEIVLDLDDIDADPKFLEWLNERDARGVIRMDLFKRAQTSSDVDRVGQFFNDYAAKKDGKISKIERQIAPEGKGSAPITDTSTNKRWTMQSIDKFYKDCNDGVYKGKAKLMAQLDESIDSAVAKAIKTGIPIPPQ